MISTNSFSSFSFGLSLSSCYDEEKEEERNLGANLEQTRHNQKTPIIIAVVTEWRDFILSFYDFELGSS